MMAGLSSIEVPLKKRKIETEYPSTGYVPSAPELILRIPSQANCSLPVWEFVITGQVEVAWSETPYSINICLTPKMSPCLPQCKALAVGQHLPLVPSQGKGCPTRTLPSSHKLNLPFLQQLFSSSIQALFPAQTLIPSQPLHIPQLQSPSLPLPAIHDGGHAPVSSTDLAMDLPSILFQPVPKAEWVQQASFHTRPFEDVCICDSFLLGHCQNRFECAQHHTPYPFHWQLRRRDVHQWVSTSHSAQVKLEKLYCNKDKDTIWLKETTEMFPLHFATMTIENSEKYDRARRLANTSDPMMNPHFPTEWQIYWWNNHSWEKYETSVSKELVTKMVAGATHCRFFIGRQEYEMDFTRLTQENLSTRFKREVRFRPTFRSPFSLRSHLRTVILSEANGEGHPSFSVDPLEDFSSWYPPVWTPISGQALSLVEVPQGTEAYQKVHSQFHRTICETKMEIVSIQQVQNVFLWDKYRRQREHMQSCYTGQGSALERHLFHGTTKDSVMDISWNNFDPRVSGKNGVMYGRGSYFARDASYSNDFARAEDGAGFQHMFLAKVLVGKMSLGERRYCRPPPFAQSTTGHELYDTCVNRLVDPSIFVVFDSCQCYPYYLIKYKVLSNTVNVFE